MVDGNGDTGVFDVADLTAAFGEMAGPVVIVDMAILVMVKAGVEVLVEMAVIVGADVLVETVVVVGADVVAETVVVVGPESDFESHVMGVSAWFGRMLKFALSRLRPLMVVSARLR